MASEMPLKAEWPSNLLKNILYYDDYIYPVKGGIFLASYKCTQSFRNTFSHLLAFIGYWLVGVTSSVQTF